MFKVGEYVIYKRDLCRIKDIVEDKYYKLEMIGDESLVISVPIENRFNYLRYPISKEEAYDLINRISDIEVIDSNDKMLENVYKELMRSNNHEDLIKIIKTTYLRNKERIDNGKKVTDKDQSFFEKAEKCLYNELSLSLGMSYLECKNFIIDVVSKESGV